MPLGHKCVKSEFCRNIHYTPTALMHFYIVDKQKIKCQIPTYCWKPLEIWREKFFFLRHTLSNKIHKCITRSSIFFNILPCCLLSNLREWGKFIVRKCLSYCCFIETRVLFYMITANIHWNWNFRSEWRRAYKSGKLSLLVSVLKSC